MRPLGIPTVRDRVVQQALKNVLEPIFEEIFLPQSHGYRPNTNAHAAVRKAEAYLEKGYHWVVDADIEGFFDHVDHQILMDLVCEKVSDGRVLSLVESFLKSGVMNEGVFEESVEGTPQGGNLSPLLANIYLNHFDRRMGDYGYLLLRYADDIVIFCKFDEPV
jgi:group II intron reverse transcriptase/maturase